MRTQPAHDRIPRWRVLCVRYRAQPGVRVPDGGSHGRRRDQARLRPPFEIRDVEEYELFDTRPISDRSICIARTLAEFVWPELPWPESLAARVKAFADDLEKLSRRHRIWIRGPVPTQRPVLADGDGDEGGYRVVPTADGTTHTIDRYFA
jgi:hypothetical protein